MLVYFLVMIVVLLMQQIPVRSNSDYKKRLFYSFLVIFLFGAFRNTIGDGWTYEQDYEIARNMTKLHDIINADEHNEAGYQILSSIMPSFKILELFIYAFVCFSLGFLFYFYISPQNSWLAFLLLFFMGNNSIFFYFGTYRNAIACSIMFMATPLLLKRRYLLFALLIPLAMSFHTSMILAMPILMICLFREKMGELDFYVWIALFLLFAGADQAGMLSFIEPYIDQYFDRYNSVIVQAKDSRMHLGFLNIIGTILLSFILLKIINDSDKAEINLPFCKLGMLYLLASVMGVFQGRLQQCYAPFFVIMLCSLYSIKHRLKPIAFSLVFVYIIYDFYLFTQSPYTIEKHLIYHSIFGDIG